MRMSTRMGTTMGTTMNRCDICDADSFRRWELNHASTDDVETFSVCSACRIKHTPVPQVTAVVKNMKMALVQAYAKMLDDGSTSDQQRKLMFHQTYEELEAINETLRRSHD
jgi:hypothetical protein